jgi:4-amino-4-deoxy-L-arabinose transferase-like glycosyltransferase
VKIPRIPIPLPLPLLVVLALTYLLVGLVGHAPWKSDDAIGVGIMHQMLDGGGLDNWLVPRLAGERYLEDGPLYYALAALCAKLLSFLLAAHDGARIASAISIGAAIWLMRTAARQLHGRHEADNAALVLIGSLGLFVHAHEVLAENGALAGAALAWLAMTRATRGIRDAAGPQDARRAGLQAGLLFGAGCSIALWSKGLMPLAPLLAAALAAPLLGSTWRSRAWLVYTVTGSAIVAAALLAWLIALHIDHPSLPAAWWQAQLRFFAAPTVARALEQLQLLSWAAWPAWPLALWALWDRRRRVANDPLLPAAAGAIVALAVFLFANDVNETAVMPLLPPLALLAGAGVLGLRRGAANAMTWFGAMTFTLLGGLVWLGWFAMQTGMPRQIALNFAKLEPGHVPQFGVAAFIVALLLTLAWLLLIFRSERSPQKSAAVWAGGVTFIWCLTMTLWLPWIDYGKTYAPVSASLQAALKKSGLPGRYCIASRGLGEAQRAAFDYHAGIVTRRLEINPNADCAALLVQATAGAPDRAGAGWRRVWEGNRPRERERFRLYVRE